MMHARISQIARAADDSACLVDLVKIKHLYFLGRTMRVRNGRRTDFWEDA